MGEEAVCRGAGKYPYDGVDMVILHIYERVTV